MDAPKTDKPLEGAILITGASGFIGSYVANFFAVHGKEVIAYDLTAPVGHAAQLLASGDKPVRYIKGSVEDWGYLLATIRTYEVDRIVHVAALQDPIFTNEHPLTTYRVNLSGLINIMEIARSEKLQRVVHISSVAALATKQYEPVDEDHPILLSDEGNPGGHYGASKAAGELIGLTYWAYSGVDVIILRLASVYGPGMTQDLYIRTMIENSVRNEPVRFTTGGQMRRDYVYIEDVAQAVHLAMTADGQKLKSRLFHIGSGTTVTTLEVAEQVRTIIPTADIEISLDLSPWEAHAIRTRGPLNIQKAQDELGYRPQYDLKNGIAEYINKFRSRTMAR